MQRTAADRRRRRHLADASTLTRARVILYANLPVGSDDQAARDVLREYGAARDWETAAEITDHAVGTVPLDDRDRWPAIQRLIEDGTAQGVVTLNPLCGASHDRARAWVADRYAWIASARPCTHSGWCAR